MIFRMAIRSLARHQRRSLICAGTVAFGVWLAALFVGTRQSTYGRLLSTSARSSYGYLTISPVGMKESQSTWLRLPDAAALAGRITAGGQEIAVPRIIINGVLTTDLSNTGAALAGIDPVMETNRTSLFRDAMISGEYLSDAEPSGGLIGTLMATRLGLSPGKKVILTTTDHRGEMVTHAASIRGVYATGSPELDGHMLVLPLAALASLTGFEPGSASVVAVYPADPPAAAADLDQERIGGLVGPGAYDIVTWRETQPDLASYMAIDTTMYRILILFVALIIATGILNTMSINVMERSREFGVMMAVGMLPFRVFALVLTEALLIGAGGLLAGALAVTPFYLWLNRVGFDMTPFLGDKLDAGGVAIDLVLNCVLRPVDILLIGAVLTGFCLAAAAAPAFRAVRMVPVKVLNDF